MRAVAPCGALLQMRRLTGAGLERGDGGLTRRAGLYGGAQAMHDPGAALYPNAEGMHVVPETLRGWPKALVEHGAAANTTRKSQSMALKADRGAHEPLQTGCRTRPEQRAIAGTGGVFASELERKLFAHVRGVYRSLDKKLPATANR